jgi:hypothetical protein
MSQHKRNPFLDTQVGKPIPGVHTFHGHHEILAIRSNSLEKALGGRRHLPVEQDLTIPVEDTDVHRSGVQINATVSFMHLGVESHWPYSSSPTAVLVASIPDGKAEEEVSIISKPLVSASKRLHSSDECRRAAHQLHGNLTLPLSKINMPLVE